MNSMKSKIVDSVWWLGSGWLFAVAWSFVRHRTDLVIMSFFLGVAVSLLLLFSRPRMVPFFGWLVFFWAAAIGVGWTVEAIAGQFDRPLLIAAAVGLPAWAALGIVHGWARHRIERSQ